MHRVIVLYNINGTVAEVTLEAPWISSQTFDSGRGILFLKDCEGGMVRGTFEAKEYFVIRIDKDVK